MTTRGDERSSSGVRSEIRVLLLRLLAQVGRRRVKFGRRWAQSKGSGDGLGVTRSRRWRNEHNRD